MSLFVKKEINKELVEYAYANLNNLPKGEEYEKMILSVPYNCFNKELWTRRNLAHEIVADYHLVRMKDYDNDLRKHEKARFDYLSTIFGKCSPDMVLEPPFYVDYGCNISFGKRFYGNFNLTFLDCTLIIFGDNVLVGPNCTFTTATHPTDPSQRLKGEEWALPITVGNNVWFGCNVVVLPGVTIGDGAVIGAGSTVSRDIPANTVAVGTPARVIKHMKLLEERDEVVKGM